MQLSDEQKEILLNDEESGRTFETFLQEINGQYKDYFSLNGNKVITDYFPLVISGRPPSVRLRYVQMSNLNEEIKQKVVSKYKELFAEYADYQII
jgi:hypothetical protein